ncbi:MAG: glycosyltransferase [Verrucomicrobia bacterium]|nr:glycosyltransferase [Verrucomicrobiota bacterium]
MSSWLRDTGPRGGPLWAGPRRASSWECSGRWVRPRAGGLDARLVSFGQAARADFLREEPTGMALGFVDEPTASRALSACDVLALPFLDGLSERRCSAMAGFAHGCCVATTLGSSTGPSLRKADFFAATPAADVAAYVRLLSELLRDARRRGELGGIAAAAYRSQYDWPGVSAVLRAQIERLRSEPR